MTTIAMIVQTVFWEIGAARGHLIIKVRRCIKKMVVRTKATSSLLPPPIIPPLFFAALARLGFFARLS